VKAWKRMITSPACHGNASNAGMAVVIASSDKDLCQLVFAASRAVKSNDKSETIWTDEQVRAKTGVNP